MFCGYFVSTVRSHCPSQSVCYRNGKILCLPVLPVYLLHIYASSILLSFPRLTKYNFLVFWMFSNWCLWFGFTLLHKRLSICNLKISLKIRYLYPYQYPNILHNTNIMHPLTIFAGIIFRGSQTIQSIYFSVLCRCHHSKYIILCVPGCFSTILAFFM